MAPIKAGDKIVARELDRQCTLMQGFGHPNGLIATPFDLSHCGTIEDGEETVAKWPDRQCTLVQALGIQMD